MLDQDRIRWNAIVHVLALREKWYAAIPASELKSFLLEGQEILLKGIQGIFKPQQLDEPLSILSTLGSPYTDELIEGQKILYDYAPLSRDYDNDGLKRCADKKLPLIYLLQLKGKPRPEYQVFAPVMVAAWDDVDRRFVIDLQPELVSLAILNEISLIEPDAVGVMPIGEMVKGYAKTPVARRMHQAKFREQVLRAYRDRCAVCVLRVRPLLDGAHIVPDRDPKPTIVVNEGMSLCATHHRALDAEILSYDSSYRIQIELPKGVKPREGERAMLLDFEGRQLTLPKDEAFWPVVRG